MRIAVMGGTFNPIHYGHLRVAEEVREGLSLNRVIFMPTSVTPHKPEEQAAPASARIEMIRLSTADNPGFEASDIEIKRGGASYTIDTVKALKEGGEKGVEVSLIVGNDSFNEITTWCDYEELLALASFVVVPRAGYPVKKIAEVLPDGLARKFWYDPKTESYLNSFGTSVTYLDTTLMDISSSDIRRRVKHGMSVRYLLPPAAAAYISRQGLYR